MNVTSTKNADKAHWDGKPIRDGYLDWLSHSGSALNSDWGSLQLLVRLQYEAVPAVLVSQLRRNMLPPTAAESWPESDARSAASPPKKWVRVCCAARLSAVAEWVGAGMGSGTDSTKCRPRSTVPRRRPAIQPALSLGGRNSLFVVDDQTTGVNPAAGTDWQWAHQRHDCRCGGRCRRDSTWSQWRRRRQARHVSEANLGSRICGISPSPARPCPPPSKAYH